MKITTQASFLIFLLTLFFLSGALLSISPLKNVQAFEEKNLYYSSEALPENIFETLQKNDVFLIQGEEFYFHEKNQFRLLGRGSSNFEGSDPNRTFNIDKGREITVNNVLLFPGESYSFNEKLGNKELQYHDGWKGALGIFEASNLERIPGGGICQVSTTLYRAVLDAGLPIEKFKNHSLWVTYYSQKAESTGLQGPGLDATIFPGKQDFKFSNPFESPIFIRNIRSEHELQVEIWGYENQESFTLTGPYTKSTLPEAYAKELSPLGLGEVVYKKENSKGEYEWLRHRYYQIVPQNMEIQTMESNGESPLHELQ